LATSASLPPRANGRWEHSSVESLGMAPAEREQQPRKTEPPPRKPSPYAERIERRPRESEPLPPGGHTPRPPQRSVRSRSSSLVSLAVQAIPEGPPPQAFRLGTERPPLPASASSSVARLPLRAIEESAGAPAVSSTVDSLPPAGIEAAVDDVPASDAHCTVLDDTALGDVIDACMQSYVLALPPADLSPGATSPDGIDNTVIVPEPLAPEVAEVQLHRLEPEHDSLGISAATLWHCQRAAAERQQEAAAQKICNSSLEELRGLPEPQSDSLGTWMIWMVHRLYLNDPQLRSLSFRNLAMPLPQDEPRIVPKLMKAVARNTYLTELSLGNSNLHGGEQVHELGQALSLNRTLEILNIQCNLLKPCDLQAIFAGLAGNKALRELRCSDQFCEEQADRDTFATLHASMQTNSTLQKLGMDLTNQYYRATILKALIRNMEAARRRRKLREEQLSAGLCGKGVEKIARDKGQREEVPKAEDGSHGSSGSQEAVGGA